MDAPTFFPHRRVAADTEILPAWMPVPGMGCLAVNCYLIRAAQPVLVDTGLAALSGALLAELEKLLDPTELRWIWITHADPDHIGGLRAVLERAPRAKVITTYLGMGKMNMIDPLPPERVHLLNPGQHIDVGDRALVALRPPTFDAPETTALVDSRTGALFSSDCFGAVVAEPLANAADMVPDDLRDGMVTWATVDAPWMHGCDEQAFDRALDRVRRLAPPVVLGSHLPPAHSKLDRLLENVRAARRAPPFVGPDQQALVQMLAAVA